MKSGSAWFYANRHWVGNRFHTIRCHTHRMHWTGISTYTFAIKIDQKIGEYTSPMDGMGYIESCQNSSLETTPDWVTRGFSFKKRTTKMGIVWGPYIVMYIYMMVWVLPKQMVHSGLSRWIGFPSVKLNRWYLTTEGSPTLNGTNPKLYTSDLTNPSAKKKRHVASAKLIYYYLKNHPRTCFSGSWPWLVVVP